MGMPSGDSKKGTSLLLIKLAALAALALSLRLYKGYAPGSGPGVPAAVLLVAAMAGLLFGLGRVAPARLDQGLALLVLCVSLVFPAVVGLSVLGSWRENRERERTGEALLHRFTHPRDAKELATFLLGPGRVAQGYDVPPEGVQRLEQYVLSLPAEEVKAHHLAESLLLGLEVEPAPGVGSGNFHTPALEAMCRLYLKLKERSGFAPETAPFYLRARDRVVSRIAELGRERWLEELGWEHPAFQQVAWGGQFHASRFEELFPATASTPVWVVSRTLGSLPLHVVLTLNLPYFPSPPGVERTVYPSTGFNRLYALNQTREALELMRSRGVDFTDEELGDPGLRAFLETVRAATPPPR